jgi:hypothetical protein
VRPRPNKRAVEPNKEEKDVEEVHFCQYFMHNINKIIVSY